MNYWQIGSGSFGRDYAKDFIRFGLAFVGGDTQVATMGKVQAGDMVIMKRGMSEIVAVGQVVERDGRHRGQDDKDWLRDFDGWDLRAYCYVDWRVPKQPIRFKGLVRATIQQVWQPHLKELADELISNVRAKRSLDPEPRETNPVDDQEILEFLIRQGLRPGAAEDLTMEFNRIRLLARYYYAAAGDFDWTDIREHETRTFLVIPLLLALGWAEQQIKIELPVKDRKRADVVCFSKPFGRKTKGRVLILETKGFSQGLDYAPDQAKAYASHFPECRMVIVTNGYCYKAFKRKGKASFEPSPSAYLNLLKPRDRYPLDPDNVNGCLEALSLLLPSSWA